MFLSRYNRGVGKCRLACKAIFIAFLFAVSKVWAGSSNSLDSLPIQAVEALQAPTSYQLAIHGGLYPFDPYFLGLGAGGAFSYRLSRVVSWETIHVTYFSASARGLITELADRFSVNPKQIERPNYQFSTRFAVNWIHGKFIFLGDSIHSFDSGIVLGGGILSTSLQNTVAFTAGLNLELLMSRTFSLRAELIDTFSMNFSLNYVILNIGTGLNF
jgi:hypothetical protein